MEGGQRGRGGDESGGGEEEEEWHKMRGEERVGKGKRGAGGGLAGNEGGPDLSERWKKDRKKGESQILKRNLLQLRES